MLGQKSLELASRQDKTAEGCFGDDVGNWDLAKQAGDFTEVIAGLQHAAVDVVDTDAGGSLEDDVETRSADALAENSLALAEEGFIEEVRDFLELGPGQVGKEGESRDRVDDIVSDCYREPSFTGCAPPGATLRWTTRAGS